jgi:hypothetical protein
MVIRDRDASKEPVSADNVEVLTPIDGATPTSDR